MSDLVPKCPRCGYECPICRALFEQPRLSTAIGVAELAAHANGKSHAPYSPDDTILNLELSVRAWNCIKDAHIQTINELIEFGPIQLLRLTNFGKTTLCEIMRTLKSRGQQLREPTREELKYGGDARRIWQECKARLEERA